MTQQFLEVHSPTSGVWIFHSTSQRPVEGFAVYMYTNGPRTWFECERCGIGQCAHVKHVIKLRKRGKNE